MSMIQRDETGTIWQYHILSSLKNNSKPSECTPGKIILIEVTEGTHLQPTATNVLSISFQDETFRNGKINCQNLSDLFQLSTAKLNYSAMFILPHSLFRQRPDHSGRHPRLAAAFGVQNGGWKRKVPERPGHVGFFVFVVQRSVFFFSMIRHFFAFVESCKKMYSIYIYIWRDMFD